MDRSDCPIRIAVVTGSRAEFGLLRPVLRAILAEEALELRLIVTGVHLLAEVGTRDEVAAEFDIVREVPMQRSGETGRAVDVEALGRGLIGLGAALSELDPQIVVALGDRIEPFAAAGAASIGGRLVAHIHGGDRAEGVADEAMRHAITKLAHIHFAATEQSAERIVRLGEDPAWVHVVGSPAIDGLEVIAPLSDGELAALLGGPQASGQSRRSPPAVILHHPRGLDHATERATMSAILEAVESSSRPRILLAPNHDPGREGVIEAIGGRRSIAHLPRPKFIGLLRRAACLIGNSSAGLIEAAALRLPVVNVGPRQNGRERGGNVIDAPTPSVEAIRSAIRAALSLNPPAEHPYGDGRSGERIAAILASLRNNRPSQRKRNQY